MDDEDAFVRAILQAPCDDALRLVYADWLEDRGDARAEYLRLLCSVREGPKSQVPYARLKELRTGLDPSWAAAVRHAIPVVRWTVPADLPCYGAYDFRVYPGTFDLFLDLVLTECWILLDNPLTFIDRVAEAVRTGTEVFVWDAVEIGATTILGESVFDCLWGNAAPWIYSGEFARVYCPGCNAVYLPGQGEVAEWVFGEGLAASGGRRYVCPKAHTLYVQEEWIS